MEQEQEDSKYYIPDMDEICQLGYRCEMQTEKGWINGTFPTILEKNPELNEFGNDTLMKAAHAILRTRYLTKEDIEECGWKHTGGQLMSSGRQDYEKGNWSMSYNTRHHTLSVFIKDPSLEEDYPNNCGTFRGTCKSINELRKIMQWIGIK